MESAVNKKINIAIKIIACIFGAVLIITGFVKGLLGTSVDGRIEDTFTRLIGIYMFGLGGLYFMPNGVLRKYMAISTVYFIVTVFPSLHLLYAYLTSNINGLTAYYIYMLNEITPRELTMSYIVHTLLYLTAPLSLLLSILNKQKRR